MHFSVCKITIFQSTIKSMNNRATSNLPYIFCNAIQLTQFNDNVSYNFHKCNLIDV